MVLTLFLFYRISCRTWGVQSRSVCCCIIKKHTTEWALVCDKKQLLLMTCWEIDQQCGRTDDGWSCFLCSARSSPSPSVFSRPCLPPGVMYCSSINVCWRVSICQAVATIISCVCALSGTSRAWWRSWTFWTKTQMTRESLRRECKTWRKKRIWNWTGWRWFDFLLLLWANLVHLSFLSSLLLYVTLLCLPTQGLWRSWSPLGTGTMR